MGGGTGSGGVMGGEQLHYGKETGSTFKRRAERAKNISQKLALLAIPIAGMFAGGIISHEWNAKDDRISALEDRNRDQDEIISTAIELGRAGVQFTDVRIIEDDVIVKVPGTSQNCPAISFNYETTTGGWQLRLDQSDAAGNIYDQAAASSAQSVSALVEDLCS